MENKKKIWRTGDFAETPELEYLRKNFGLIMDPDTFTEMYRIKLDGKWSSFPDTSTFTFWDIQYDENGNVTDMKFEIKSE